MNNLYIHIEDGPTTVDYTSGMVVSPLPHSRSQREIFTEGQEWWIRLSVHLPLNDGYEVMKTMVQVEKVCSPISLNGCG